MSHVRRPFRRNPSGNERERTGSLAFCPPLYDSIHTHTIAEFSITLFSGGLTQNESSLKKKDQMLSLLASGRVATRGIGKQLLRHASAKPGGAGGRTKLVILGTGWGGFRLGKSLAQAGCNAHRRQLSWGCTGLLHLFVVGSAHVRLLCVSPFDVCVCVPGAAALDIEQDTPIERWFTQHVWNVPWHFAPNLYSTIDRGKRLPCELACSLKIIPPKTAVVSPRRRFTHTRA